MDALDTNLLVYAHNTENAETNTPANRAISAFREGVSN